MPLINPIYDVHAHVTTPSSKRCTHRWYLRAQVHGTQERPGTQYKQRTSWSRSTRTTTAGGNPQRRARRQQQQPKKGESARPTPMTSAAPGAGDTHQAHLPTSPTHTVYSAEQEPTTQCRTGHYPGTANTTGPQGGKTKGEGTTRRQLEPEPNQTPSQRADYSASATIRTASTTKRQQARAWTAWSIAKTRTTATYRGATPTTSTAPTMEAEGEHQTYTSPALHTPCTAHNERNPTHPRARRPLPRGSRHNRAPRAKGSRRTEGTPVVGPGTGPKPITAH